jgi:hypothetical protein
VPIFIGRGAPDTIQTCGLRLRRATHYPAELRCLLLTQCLRGFRVWVKPQRRSPRKPLHYNTLSSSLFAPAGLTRAFGGNGHAVPHSRGIALSTKRKNQVLGAPATKIDIENPAISRDCWVSVFDFRHSRVTISKSLHPGLWEEPLRSVIPSNGSGN